MLNRIQLALRSVEAVFDAVTSLAMFVVMVLVSTDVAMRYLFNHPLSWSYDVISMYLMATVFLLALSSTLRHNHHVRVDILFQLASPRARMAMELVGYTLMAIVMSGIFEHDEQKNVSKFPLLGHIPIVGELFKNRVMAGTKRELVIFVTPRIVNPDTERIRKLIDDIKTRYKQAKDEVSYGIFD